MKSEVGIFDLIDAFHKVLRKVEARQEDLREIFQENFTVSDKIDYLLRTIAGGKSLRFSDLFVRATSTTEIVVTFLALLELIRLKQLSARQEKPFSEIEIQRLG